MTKEKFKKFEKMVNSKNPLTMKQMSQKLNISVPLIEYHIHKTLNKKSVEKPKVHTISKASIEKSRRRLWLLYLKLNNVKWKNYMTTDESWFYLSNSSGQTNIQYITRGKTRASCKTYKTVKS
jgi:orotate phosphoribosyltransferase-like protein